MSAPAGEADAKKTAVCGRCNEPIKQQAFVQVSKYAFHKQCFTCFECDRSLHGIKFIHKGGKFYCTDDYKAKFSKKCKACGLVITSRFLNTPFGPFHHDCLCCTTCEKKFTDGRLFTHEGKPYCEEHYQEMYGEKCAACGKVIVDLTSSVTAQDRKYHSTCLSCDYCRTPLGQAAAAQGDTRFYKHEDKIYCARDYFKLFVHICTKCGESITDKRVSVNDEVYHPACMTCSICTKQLTAYLCRGGSLRCEEHVNDPVEEVDCDVCGTPIRGEVVCAVGKKVHVDCFNCSKCDTPFPSKRDARLQADALVCMNCLMAERKTRPSIPHRHTKSVYVPKNREVGQKRMADLTSPPVPQQEKPHHRSAATSFIGSRSSPAAPVPPSLASKIGDRKMQPEEHRERSVEEKIEWQKGSLIGTGSFGKVYMAMNKKTGELIAVKQVTFSSDEDDMVAGIMQEIDLMKRLNHPNIVLFLGCERTGKKLNILMEYVPGSSLDALLNKFGAFSEEVVCAYTKQLLEALNYCHKNRVTHRDIKGKNILVDTHGNLKLADFGSAKRFDNFLSKDAPSVSYSYTPLWTAPEVLMGNYNYKIDVWSLGCVIIEMATAEQPWGDKNFENPFRALYHIGNSDEIPKLPPTFQGDALDFLLKCLDRNPATRWDCEQLLQHPWIKSLDAE